MMRMLIGVVRRTRLIPLVTILVFSGPAFAQPTYPQGRTPPPLPPGTSAIRGTLTDAITKAPVAGCTVRAGYVTNARPPSSRFGEAITGADGTYEFAGIADGSYWLTVRCPSYVLACLAPEHPPNFAVNTVRPCTDLQVFKDQQRSNVDFKLTPAAIIRGRVVDSFGKPVANASVRLGRQIAGNTLVLVAGSTTKDDGAYELNGLTEGAWLIEAEIPPAPGAYRSQVIFYPGVLTHDDANAVEVETGKVKEGITITVPAILESTLTVKMPPPDPSMTDLTVSVIRAAPLMTRRLDLDADGQAVVKGLTDGRYIALATALSGDQRWADYQAVDFIDGSVDVTLQLRPTGGIRGRIVADRGGLPSFYGTSIAAPWMEGDVALNPLAPEEAKVADDGTFEIGGLFGRRRLQLIRFDPSWQIYSVLQGNSDMTSSGIDIAPGVTTDVTIVVRQK